jgi:uncharacterized membrane protein
MNSRPSDATSALIHLYRAEVGRLTAYRVRLDTTTNWAITTSALVISFTLANRSDPARGDPLADVEAMRNPGETVNFLGALGWRLRRNYLWIYTAVVLAWIGKLYLEVGPAASVEMLASSAGLGPFPGVVVAALVALFYCYPGRRGCGSPPHLSARRRGSAPGHGRDARRVSHRRTRAQHRPFPGPRVHSRN